MYIIIKIIDGTSTIINNTITIIIINFSLLIGAIGANVGANVWDVGTNEGTDEGIDEGADEGADECADEGTNEGTDVGDVGTNEGTDVGDVGTNEGIDVGDVGTNEGTDVGDSVGTSVGAVDGELVYLFINTDCGKAPSLTSVFSSKFTFIKLVQLLKAPIFIILAFTVIFVRFWQ